VSRDTSIGSLSDPAVRKERAHRGGASRTTVDYYVSKLVDRAPELTPEQRDRLAALLRPPTGGDVHGDAA
jgi:hypothetical protein